MFFIWSKKIKKKIFTIGDAICALQKHTRMRPQLCAKILNVSMDELEKIESNTMAIPYDTLMNILHGGFIVRMLRQDMKRAESENALCA